MLTKTDLQQIRGVVREEVKITKSELGNDIAMFRARVAEEFRGVNNRLKNLEIGVVRLEKGQRKIQKDLAYQINILDKDHLSNLRRIERIEEKLQIQPTV